MLCTFYSLDPAVPSIFSSLCTLNSKELTRDACFPTLPTASKHTFKWDLCMFSTCFESIRLRWALFTDSNGCDTLRCSSILAQKHLVHRPMLYPCIYPPRYPMLCLYTQSSSIRRTDGGHAQAVDEREGGCRCTHPSGTAARGHCRRGLERLACTTVRALHFVYSSGNLARTDTL